jgi:hypothetical protein
MSIRPDDPRLAGLPEEDLNTMVDPNFSRGETTATVNPTLAYEAAGLYGDTATSQYIRDLVAGVNVGAGTVEQRNAALQTLIDQGQIRQQQSSGDTGDGTDNTGVTYATPPGATTLAGSAANELKAILRRYNLESLFGPLSGALIGDPSLIRNTDALFGAVRETPQYQARFKGNIERAKKNLPLLSEAEYISQEQSYQQVNKSLGLPRGFYDTQDDFANFIANDVSPVEYSKRIEQGYNVVKNSSPEVLNQLKMLVPDLQDADLAAYVLDPIRSGQEIERKVRAARIAAAGKVSGGMQLTGTQAESLAQQGVTAEMAQQGFTQLGQSAGLFRPLQGEETITQEDILAGTFTNEQAAQQRIARRRRRRQAEFEAGGGFAGGTGTRNIGLSTVE